MKLLKVLFTFTLFILPTLATAVPLQIPYSGQLSESGTLVNGTRAMTFVIYDAASGGSALYTQAEPTVAVTNGVYHTTLNAPDTVWTGADRWLGVSVNGGTELTPRTKIGSVPYAVRSQVASLANALTNPQILPGLNWADPSLPVQSLQLTTADTWTAIDSVTINTPNDGYVVVITSGLGYVTLPTCVELFLSTPTPIPSPVLGDAAVGGSLTTTGQDWDPVVVSKVFPVTSGLQIFTLFAKLRCTTSPNAIFYNMRVIALFFPNRYQ